MSYFILYNVKLILIKLKQILFLTKLLFIYFFILEKLKKIGLYYTSLQNI